MAIERQAMVVLAAVTTLVVGGCDRRRQSEPVDRSTTTTAAELEREQTTEGGASPIPGVIVTIDLDDRAAATDASAERRDEEPRGADRYSIVATPDLERNLGLTGDGGAATPTDTAREPEPAPAPAPEPRRPSAADPVPWP